MITQDLHRDKLLLQSIADGDAIAFREFFDLYKDRLFLFVEQLIHSKADAEEIVQDTFLKVWQTAYKLVEIDQPGYYIYTIARNKTLNFMRSISRQQHLVDQVWAMQGELDATLEEKLRTKELKEIIDKIVFQLSPQKQLIFQMSREQGLNHAEIANLLGLSQSRVKNVLVEILKYIKTNLQQHSDIWAILFWIQHCQHLF